MSETTVVVKASFEVRADPEMAWSLLGSAEVWSLRLGFFAFDAVAADSGLVRCLLQATRTDVGHAVLTVRDERPGAAATWEVGASGQEVTLSARPHRRGAVVAAALRFAADRGSAHYLRRSWDRMLGAWLARACHVLEGRHPWPAGMPADVRRACAARRALRAPQSVSASVLIAAPIGVVWDAVWSPQTAWPVHNPDFVACGTVPGTPLQQAGEMQYFVSRTGDGHLDLGIVCVREMAYQRSATTQAVRPPHDEMDYLLTAETDATRLDLTARWDEAAMTGEPQLARRDKAEFVRSAAEGYKAAIEESEHAA